MNMIIIFLGTGMKCDDDYVDYIINDYGIPEDVLNCVICVINGCQEKDVGNGLVSPDLYIASRNVYRAFDTLKSRAKDISNILKGCFGSGLAGVRIPREISSFHDPKLILYGFSRGAVTCFATAKYFHKMGSKVDIHIIANQPVPGNAFFWGDAKRFSHLDNCSNIKTAYIVLGAYKNWDHNIAPVIRSFYKQMLPSFHPGTNVNAVLLPIPSHMTEFSKINQYTAVSLGYPRMIKLSRYLSSLYVRMYMLIQLKDIVYTNDHVQKMGKSLDDMVGLWNTKKMGEERVSWNNFKLDYYFPRANSLQEVLSPGKLGYKIHIDKKLIEILDRKGLNYRDFYGYHINFSKSLELK